MKNKKSAIAVAVLIVAALAVVVFRSTDLFRPSCVEVQMKKHHTDEAVARTLCEDNPAFE